MVTWGWIDVRFREKRRNWTTINLQRLLTIKIKKIAFTAIPFVGIIAAVIVTVTDPACWDAASCVVALELIITTRYIHKQTTHCNCCAVIRTCSFYYYSDLMTVMKAFARPALCTCGKLLYLLSNNATFWCIRGSLLSCKTPHCLGGLNHSTHFASAYETSF